MTTTASTKRHHNEQSRCEGVIKVLRIVAAGLAFLRNIQRCTVREGEVIGFVEVVQTDVVLAEVELDHQERA